MPNANMYAPSIKNLVFKGGGPKGIAYVGALEALKEKMGDDFAKIERVAGTSAGAITAALLSVGYTPQATKELLTKTQFKEFILDNDSKTDDLVVKLANNATEKSSIKKGLKMSASIITHLISMFHLVKKFYKHKGFCSGEVFRLWLDDAISEKVAEIEEGDKSQYKNLTFGQLKQLQEQKPDKYKKLYIVGGMFDESSKLDKPRIYSTDEVGVHNYIISDAVRVSMSIPFLFSPHPLYYLNAAGERTKIETKAEVPGGIDGGVLKNYPLDMFDFNKYLSGPFLNKAPDAKVVNPETLGFDLYTKKEISLMAWFKRTIGAIKDLKKRNDEPLKLDTSKELQLARIIAIDVVGVTLFDFDMPQPTIEKLQQSGRSSIEQYWGSDIEKLKIQQAIDGKESEDSSQVIIKNFAVLSNLKSNVAHYQIPTAYEVFLKNRLESKIDAKERHNNKNQVEISGMGGSGKSQLALYGAEQYFKSFLRVAWQDGYGWSEGYNKATPVVWFVNAENEATILTSMQKLAEKLKCATSDNLNELSANIFNHLKNNNPYLLIFDNLVDRKLIEYWQANIHGSQNGMLLITSQDKSLADNRLNNCIYIDLDDGLSDEAASILVQELCPRLKGQDLPPLTKRLYNLPLALTVAATYLNHRMNETLSVQDYITSLDNLREELNKKQLKLIQANPNPNLLEKKQTQEAAISMSISNMVKDEETQNLLILCSCLGADSITDELLKYLLDYDIEAAIEKLRCGSLIRDVKFLGEGKQVLAMHRFIQEVARSHYREHLSLDWYNKLLSKTHKFINTNLKSEHDYYQKRDMLTHLDSIFAGIDAKYKINDYTSEIIQGHIDLSLLHKAVGHAAMALSHYEKILAWVEKNKATNKDLAIEFYVGLGRAYQGGPGDFVEAKKCYEKAYELHSKEPSPKLAEILNDLAMSHRDIGGRLSKTKAAERIEIFRQALNYISQAIEIAESISGQNSNLVRYKINCGEIYRQLKEFDKAEESVKNAIEIGEVEFKGQSHRVIAAAYFNLGKLFISKGKYESQSNEDSKKCFTVARENFSEAVRIDKDVYKEPHPLIARHTDALGKAYRKLDDENEACQSFQEASQILKFSKGAQMQLKEKVSKHVESCLNRPQ